jgi:hypothetical protein
MHKIDYLPRNSDAFSKFFRRYRIPHETTTLLTIMYNYNEKALGASSIGSLEFPFMKLPMC